ncbi:glycosyltransferase [Pseudarthrobacter sp. H2]|uniref:glycosyltransferase n=1 Tax=Pseudarthrobacter sp. H2 TaxID=3418415 RepID=UPI003CF828F3
MRIGIGLAGLQFGGCQINALDLAKELTRRGHEVVAFAIHDTPLISVAPLADKLGIALHILPVEKNPFRQARHVAKLVSDHRLDIVHVFGAWLAEPTTLALRSRPETALVVTNWTMDNIKGLPPMTPLILGTESLQEEAAHAVRSAPVWVLEPPVDTTTDQHDERARSAFREQWSVNGTTTLLVIVSRLDYNMKAEGIADAIRAMELSPDPTRQLAVVGGGDAQHALSQLADEVNTALGWRAVVMTGPLEDPSSAYSAADLVLGMGGAALRALAFQKPLVVLGEDGFSKPFTPETVGYFLHEGFYGRGNIHDPVNSLHTSIVSTLALARSSDLAHWGRQVLLTRFSLSRAADRLLTIYDIALKRTTSLRRAADATYVSARYLAGRSRHAWQVVTRISQPGGMK